MQEADLMLLIYILAPLVNFNESEGIWLKI